MPLRIMRRDIAKLACDAIVTVAPIGAGWCNKLHEDYNSRKTGEQEKEKTRRLGKLGKIVKFKRK